VKGYNTMENEGRGGGKKNDLKRGHVRVSE
jgi:hypothetical protein